MPTVFTDGTVLTGPALTAALAVATADAASSSPVTSVAGRVGAISLAVADVAGAYAATNPAGYITGASPVLTGTPTAPTATLGTSTTQLATTAFVAASVVAATTGVATFNTRSGAITLTSGDVTSALTFTPYNATNPSGYQTAAQVTTTLGAFAPLASPTLTGIPRAPTVASTSAAGTTQIATTAFVRNGTTTSDSAVAGQVGEYISANLTSGSAVSLTSNTPANIASISLTAGDWDVGGSLCFSPAGSTVVLAWFGCINTSSATFPTQPNGGAYFLVPCASPAGSAATLPTGRMRLSLATTTTVFLIAQSTFTTSTQTAYGFIGARRIR